jgi:putative hydrolase of the HAD superfamily
MRPHAISFDLDNTLFDRRSSLRIFTPQFMARFSTTLADVSENQVLMSIVAADAGGGAPREQAMIALSRAALWKTAPHPSELWSFWSDCFPKCVKPQQGMRLTLDGLAVSGLRLAVASNGWSSLQREKLRSLEIHGLFEAVIIGEEVGVEKPDPRFFERLSTTLRISPDRIWHVGDDPLNDVMASSLAGFCAVWLAGREGWPSNYDCPRMTITTLPEIFSLLDHS